MKNLIDLSDIVSFLTEILIFFGIITSVNNFDDSFTKNLDTSRRPEQRRHLSNLPRFQQYFMENARINERWTQTQKRTSEPLFTKLCRYFGFYCFCFHNRDFDQFPLKHTSGPVACCTPPCRCCWGPRWAPWWPAAPGCLSGWRSRPRPRTNSSGSQWRRNNSSTVTKILLYFFPYCFSNRGWIKQPAAVCFILSRNHSWSFSQNVSYGADEDDSRRGRVGVYWALSRVSAMFIIWESPHRSRLRCGTCWPITDGFHNLHQQSQARSKKILTVDIIASIILIIPRPDCRKMCIS